MLCFESVLIRGVFQDFGYNPDADADSSSAELSPSNIRQTLGATERDWMMNGCNPAPMRRSR